MGNYGDIEPLWQMNYNAFLEKMCMRRKRICFYLTLLTLLLTVLLVTSCGKNEKPSHTLYRLIDSLHRKDILQSPLAQLEPPLEPKAQVFPVDSYPLSDAGIDENVYFAKRKLKLGGAEKNVIFSPPESVYRFNPNITENCRLVFGIGIVRRQQPEGTFVTMGEGQKGVDFQIILESRGRKKRVFQKYVQPPEFERKENFIFSSHSIDLAPSLEDTRLLFITRGEESCFSFWENPVVYGLETKTRGVILISIDTLRADHLGCYGYKRETSPHIDALAEDSAVFLNAYAASPWTLPSHVSMLTSLFGVHHQVYQETDKMDPSLMTLADFMRSGGFFCTSFNGGGFVSSIYGFSKGFDSYHEGEGGVFHQDSAERVFHSVLNWLEIHRDRNFFLFVHTYQPHSPYACPFPYKVMFLDEDSRFTHLDLLSYLGGKSSIFKPLPEKERENIIGLYDGEVRYTDDKLIGPLIAKLKEMGLYEESLIVFTSDHGEEFFDHGGWGHGHSLYNEALKVPLVIKFPKEKFKGKTVNQIVTLVDIMPTVLDEMGLDFSEDEIDGRSLLPFLEGKEREDRVYLADIGSNVLGSRIPKSISTNKGKWKLILSQKFRPEERDFFAFPPPQIGPVEFYHLVNDPYERTNLADKNPDRVNRVIHWVNEYYAKARKRKVEKAKLNEQVESQLRALGYIQ